jgi:pSer/pThr/pTyr-binding forkhead associated (FHA) protein
MTDQVLNILKFVLLGLLYLFFARVLWAVWSEVRTPVRRASSDGQRDVASQPRAVSSAAPTAPTPRPSNGATAPVGKRSRRAAAKQAKKPTGKGSRPASRLVVLEPPQRRGLTVAIAGEITLGREPGCTISIDDDAFVSQIHLRIFDYDGQPMVEDLGSTNGTYHNGVKLTGAKLLHRGDRLQVGTTLIEAQ